MYLDIIPSGVRANKILKRKSSGERRRDGNTIEEIVLRGVQPFNPIQTENFICSTLITNATRICMNVVPKNKKEMIHRNLKMLIIY